MRVDLFAHFTTQEFRQEYLSIPLGAKGRRLDPLAIRTFVQAQRTTDIEVLWDMEQRLRVLDRYGIDLQVLTLCFPIVGGLEPEEELRLARMANDGLAEIVQRYPHRFLGVATLPFSSPAEALREFDRCVDSLGFKGFQISSNVNGTLLDSSELFPIYEHAAQRGLLEPGWSPAFPGEDTGAGLTKWTSRSFLSRRYRVQVTQAIPRSGILHEEGR